MKVFTNKTAAEKLDIPTSTWGWHKRRGTIPKGDLRLGERRVYTESQLNEIAAKLKTVSYTRGKRGRKRKGE